MIVTFTQCYAGLERCERSLYAATLPIRPRCVFYEDQLQLQPLLDWTTFDEHLLLIAQWLVRRGKIAHKSICFISVCGCGREWLQKEVLGLDQEGNFTDDMPHGYFSERLRYLR